jgi:hypothetical protein
VGVAEQLQTLTDAEVADLLALVKSRRAASPAARVEAEAAAYRERVAEREAREAADPELQRSRHAAALEAEHKREAERKTELADLEALAKLDPRTLAQPHLEQGETAIHRCLECRVPAFDAKLIGSLGMLLCLPCHARHRLKCDVCGAGKGVLANWCTDFKWRCDTCAAEYLAKAEAAR